MEYVLVTGASSGIGRATAIKLSKSHKLILNGRNLQGLNETNELCADSNKNLIWQYDLNDVQNLNASLKSLINENQINIQKFVHSAGIAPLSSLRMLSLDLMQSIFNVNFFSAVEILKLLTNKKVNGKNLNKVVMISSIASQLGAKGQSIYCAAKSAVEGFVRAFAEEFPSININVIRAGGIITPIGEVIESNQELLSRPIDENYLLGLGEPDDIAYMVEYLLSEKAKWITGQSFNVDGGRTAH